MNSATSFTKYCTVDTNHVAIVKQLAYDSHRLAQPQMAAIENLDHDWSRIVDKNGKQLATVRHHFQLSQAFNKSGLEHMSREGTCIACHKEITANSAAINLLHHIAKYTGQIPKSADQHNSLLHKSPS